MEVGARREVVEYRRVLPFGVGRGEDRRLACARDVDEHDGQASGAKERPEPGVLSSFQVSMPPHASTTRGRSTPPGRVR